MRLPCLTLVLCLFCTAGWSEDQPYISDMKARFKPVLPTVALIYKVSYRLLGMNLVNVAQARLETTEGYWTKTGATNPVRSCFIELTLQTPNWNKENAAKARVYIHDHLISVVTMPELNTLYYIKKTDESIRPPFTKGKRVDSLHIYDLESGDLSFYSTNYLTGKICTNLLGGAVDIAAQGREVIDVLKTMSDVYNKKIPSLTPKSDFRIFVNCDGIAVPFAAHTRSDKIRILGKRWNSLRCDIMPAKEAPRIKSRDFATWAVSLVTLQEVIDKDKIMDIAPQTPDWSMTTLLAN